MTKHTPGPWRVADRKPDIPGTLEIDSNGWHAHSIIYYRMDELDNPELIIQSEANANLIAASPELLEACKAIFNNKKCLLEVDEVKLLCKAIAKAEGK